MKKEQKKRSRKKFEMSIHSNSLKNKYANRTEIKKFIHSNSEVKNAFKAYENALNSMLSNTFDWKFIDIFVFLNNHILTSHRRATPPYL